ncbi:UNVERIFIED_CONTAM: Bifunctional bis(5'-adenosyl)-triphosphatase/adenylylsulfatase FHIT, partial [Sesamum radiatum]
DRSPARVLSQCIFAHIHDPRWAKGWTDCSTCPHPHTPRKSGDFENNDEIYEAIDSKEKELKQKLDLDKERKDRSMEEMAEEAAEYRKLFS